MRTPLLDRISKQGRDFLGVRYPFICGAMTWISDPQLVAAVSDAGGFACLAGGNMPTDQLQQQIAETRRRTDKPFGVNLITIAPAYRDHLALVRDIAVPVVIFAANFPRRAEIESVKKAGSKVLCFASTHSIANRMLDYGADGLILEGMEAGGHVGRVTLTILLQQVLFEVPDVPIFVAGGIATGRMCAPSGDFIIMRSAVPRSVRVRAGTGAAGGGSTHFLPCEPQGEKPREGGVQPFVGLHSLKVIAKAEAGLVYLLDVPVAL